MRDAWTPQPRHWAADFPGVCPPPPPQPHADIPQILRTATSSSTNSVDLDNFPATDPPLEYATDQGRDEAKRGLLSSILDKVRSKDEQASLGKRSGVSSESLPGSDSTSRRSEAVKPYEPPALGKSSRVTPVGLDEEPERLSQDSCLETDSVEVLSVIRFNKTTKFSSSNASEKRSSSSDTNSVFNPCPSCDGRDRQTPSSLRSHVTSSVGRSSRARSQDSELLSPRRSEVSSAEGSRSLPSTILRRSSAPEIEGDEEYRGSRSLERPKRVAYESSGVSSDSESIPGSAKHSVGSVDNRDLRRAVKHLQEELQDKKGEEKTFRSEVKADVHREPAATGTMRPKRPAEARRKGSTDNVTESGAPLKKADSFEGHEEAVRTLVEAVQESRKAEAAKKKDT